MKAGASAVDAAEKSFAGGIAGLEKDLKAYSSRSRLPYTTFRKTGMPDPVVTVADLDAAAADRLPLEMIWMTGADQKDRRARFLTMASDLVARSPDDLVAAELLAEAYAANERSVDASMRADAVLARDPDNARALLLKAQLHLQAAKVAPDEARRTTELKSAREAILHANRVAMGDVRPLIDYYGFYCSSGRPPRQDAFDAIAAAFAVLPQDDSTRVLYSDSLARQGKYDRAIEVLMPLVNSPHSDGSSARGLQQEYRCMAASGGKPCPPDNAPKEELKSAKN